MYKSNSRALLSRVRREAIPIGESHSNEKVSSSRHALETLSLRFWAFRGKLLMLGLFVDQSEFYFCVCVTARQLF